MYNIKISFVFRDYLYCETKKSSLARNGTSMSQEDSMVCKKMKKMKKKSMHIAMMRDGPIQPTETQRVQLAPWCSQNYDPRTPEIRYPQGSPKSWILNLPLGQARLILSCPSRRSRGTREDHAWSFNHVALGWSPKSEGAEVRLHS